MVELIYSAQGWVGYFESSIYFHPSSFNLGLSWLALTKVSLTARFAEYGHQADENSAYLACRVACR